MTPREYAKANRHIGEAWEDGKTIQFRPNKDSKWHDWSADVRPSFCCPSDQWRIKPEPPQPKYRAWKPEEVPPSAMYRRKSWASASPGSWAVIVGVCAGQIVYISGGVFRDSPADALAHGEHSIDGGKTWRPCGVEVKE